VFFFILVNYGWDVNLWQFFCNWKVLAVFVAVDRCIFSGIARIATLEVRAA